MVYSMPKNELEIILEEVKSSANPNEVAVNAISKILRGNEEPFKIHHIIEEVWSLKQALKHFSLVNKVGVVKDGLAVLTTEGVSENTKLFPLPQTGLTTEEIDNLIGLLEVQKSPQHLITIEKLKVQKYNN